MTGYKGALPRPPNPSQDPAGYLKSIHAVREQCRIVLDKAKKNDLKHFDVDHSKFADTARFVVMVIKRDFEPDYSKIPPHGRWQHFNVGGRHRVEQMLGSWSISIDSLERTRRLIDLFVVSVLLDAGAGSKWSYKSKDGSPAYARSEGLAVASLDMFMVGLFSSDQKQPHQVNGQALQSLAVDQLANGLQVTASNPVDGLDGRHQLLVRLGDALQQNKDIFGKEARPGNILDYLLAHPATQKGSSPTVPLSTLWTTLMDGLVTIWPSTRTQINGMPLGDAWPCQSLPADPSQPWKGIVPFHKLTQWLTYSLMVPMEKLAKIRFAGVELMTGLPEYRNGGLFVDMGLLTLKPEDHKRGIEQFHKNASREGQQNIEVVPLFTADDDVVVEWRALIVGYLDELLAEVNHLLGLSGKGRLSLAQMLEAGSWKGGRELAELSRPITKAPPIMILSDGTVF